MAASVTKDSHDENSEAHSAPVTAMRAFKMSGIVHATIVPCELIKGSAAQLVVPGQG